MLLAWLQDGRHCDLIAILDGAASEIYYAQLVEEEGTRTLRAGAREVIEQQGLRIPAYSPQARVRMERRYRTWQGRLPQS